MARELWKSRVVADPAIHHGEPCIRGTRIPVAIIVGSVADGLSAAEVIEEYPQLTPDDIRAALKYAAEAVQHEVLIPFAT